MKEKKEHIDLKQFAKNMLVNMGFKLDEIYEEHRVNIDNFSSKPKYFIVDVCGIKNEKWTGIKKSVAIECGRTNAEKLVNLNLFFDEVYHLPYGLKKVDDFDQVYEDAINEISNLKEIITEKNRTIRQLEGKLRHETEYKEKWLKARELIAATFKLTHPYGMTYALADDIEELLNKLIQSE